jgi:hypothetical protein
MPDVCEYAPRCPTPADIDTVKKNQMAGEIEAKKKEQESLAKREMHGGPHTYTGR